MKKNLETLCVHGGYKPRKGEPQQMPIIQSTTFKYDTSEQMARLFDLQDSGYFYTRLANPSNDYVTKKIVALEGGTGGLLTSSGQAANFYAVFNICEAGDHFITSNAIYGGTFNLFGVTMKKLGHRMHIRRPGMGRRKDRGGFPPQHQMLLRRDHIQPRRPCVRHRAVCQDGASARRAADCRQHFCYSNQLPAV